MSYGYKGSVYALQKRAIQLLPLLVIPLLSSPRLSPYIRSSPLPSLLANPLLVLQSHTNIKITQWDPTADTTLTATSRLRLLSVEDQWSVRIVPAAPTSLLFCSRQPQCCCFLICGVRGWGGFNNFTCLFYFCDERGGMWELLFLI